MPIPLRNAVFSDGGISSQDGGFYGTYIVNVGHDRVVHYKVELPAEIVLYFEEKSGLERPKLEGMLKRKLMLVLDI